MSKRAKKAAEERLRVMLFGEKGLQRPEIPQPSEIESLRRQANELRELANRGMKPKSHTKKANELEARANELEQQLGSGQGSGQEGTIQESPLSKAKKQRAGKISTEPVKAQDAGATPAQSRQPSVGYTVRREVAELPDVDNGILDSKRAEMQRVDDEHNSLMEKSNAARSRGEKLSTVRYHPE